MINIKILKTFVDNFPTNFIQILMTYVMQLQNYIKQFFRTTPNGCRQILIQIQV